MTAIGTIKMTARQYLQLGEDPPGVRLELVNGEIIVSPSPTTAHAVAISELLVILVNHIKRYDLGRAMSDTDHVVSEFTVRRPDIYYFSKARLHLIGDEHIEGPPDLAVEILSPGSEHTDRRTKFEEYQEFGIANYWIIDPKAKTAEAFKLRRKRYVPAGSGRSKDTVSFPPFPDLPIHLPDLWWPRK
jgi:Uma2 family endonuclease